MNNEFDIQLLVSYLTGDCSQNEQLQVEQWIAMSNENANMFDEFKQVWDSSSVKSNSQKIDVNKAWNIFKDRTDFDDALNTENTTHVEVVKPIISKQLYFYSSAVAAIALVMFSFYLFFNNDTTVELQNSTALYTDINSPVILPDGSSVTLNKHSSVNYPNVFADLNRNVNFTGEAFFDVSHNPEKPMIIAADNVRVKVLGTSFNLCNYVEDDEITVYLETGKILFYSVDEIDGSIIEQIVLTPGQKGIYNKNTGSISKRNFVNNNHIAWKTGVLDFVNAPLSDVIKQLEHTYNITVNTKLPLADYKLTARFSNDSVTNILESLQIIYGFKYKVENNSVLLY